MCKYCDVRMPDGCGFELKSGDGDIELLIYPGGNVHINHKDGYGNTYHDTIRFNYCPVCGKPLNPGNDFEELPTYVYLVRDACCEYEVYDNLQAAKEFAEEVASERGEADMLTALVINSNTCEMRCCWDNEE